MTYGNELDVSNCKFGYYQTYIIRVCGEILTLPWSTFLLLWYGVKYIYSISKHTPQESILKTKWLWTVFDVQ